MAKCRSYGKISRRDLERLRADLAKAGVVVGSGDEVFVRGPYGIRLSATYLEEPQTLEICIVEKPFAIPMSRIWVTLDNAIVPHTQK
ncbi:MAG: hypothetical protein ACP5GX_03355 [Anaerolineae bacterium]